MNQGLLRLFLWLNSAKVNACSLLELVAALTSAGMPICRCRFENPWLFSGKEHIINSASHTSPLNVYGKPTDGSLFWEVELKIRQKQIPCPSSCPSRHLTSGPAVELVLCCSISHVLSHSPWRFCQGLRCRSAFLGTHQPFPIRVGHWSNGVMVKSGALRRFFSSALLNVSRKTSYPLLAISTLLQLESVAMCGTCQACRKQKNKRSFLVSIDGEIFSWGHSRSSYVRLMHSYCKWIYQFVQCLNSVWWLFEKISWPDCFCMGKWRCFWVVIINLLKCFQKTCISE